MVKLFMHMATADVGPQRMTDDRRDFLRRAGSLLESEKDELFAHIAVIEAELAEAKADNVALTGQLAQMRRSRDEVLKRIDAIAGQP